MSALEPLFPNSLLTASAPFVDSFFTTDNTFSHFFPQVESQLYHCQQSSRSLCFAVPSPFGLC
jgi:hypothetical protein